jgi:hypothetical protein
LPKAVERFASYCQPRQLRGMGTMNIHLPDEPKCFMDRQVREDACARDKRVWAFMVASTGLRSVFACSNRVPTQREIAGTPWPAC